MQESQPPVRGAAGDPLAGFGYSGSETHLGEVFATASRGTPLVVVTPPAAVHAVPGIAGALAAARERPGLLLVLVPEAALDEWEAVTRAVAGSGGPVVHAVRTLSRAARILQAGEPSVLIAPPDAALALARRSALKAEQVAGLLVAWPEFWPDDEPLAALMQDLPRELPRVIYTTDATRVASLVERYARRAHTVGPLADELPGERPDPARTASLRTVLVGWTRRADALHQVIELLDPRESAAWTVTAGPGLVPPVPPGTSPAARTVPATGLVVCCDLPTAAQLAQLAAAAEEVVLLVPPVAADWIRRVAPQAKPLQLAGAADATLAQVRARRRTVAETIEQRPLEGPMLALAPLFEQHDPARVAAALYALWLDTPGAPAAATPETPAAQSPAPASTTRIWAGVGKKDGATANDFVGVLTRELGVDRAKIGKIEIRELYSLIEVPAAESEELAGRLNGVTVRRRRVNARVDRGRPAR